MASRARARGRHRLFLLSPANAGGVRASLLLRAGATFPLSRAVQSPADAPPGEGLVAPETRVTASDLRSFAAIPIDPRDARYRAPLERDVRALAGAAPRAEVVLLGSIASGKYVDVLLAVLGDRLLFPEAFVGRGDMSRGGLMLRCV